MGSKKDKAQFYVFYLGWKECRGLGGREFVEPIVRELIQQRSKEALPKLTIGITSKELKITQLIERAKKGGGPAKVEKIKYPPIPTKDVTYTAQALAPDDDVVACIYLGFNPQTRAAVHVHVYRCDSPTTAGVFVDHLNEYINLPANKERARKIEDELVAKHQVYPRPTDYYGHVTDDVPRARSTGPYGAADDDDDDRLTSVSRNNPYPAEDPYGRAQRRPYGGHDNRRERPPASPRDKRNNYRDYGDYGDYREIQRQREAKRGYEDPYGYHRRPEPRGPPPPDPHGQQEEIYQSVTQELKAKLQGRAPTGPMLFPPKDYDTLHRGQGKLTDIEERKSRNKNIVGPKGANNGYGRDEGSDGSDHGSSGYRNSYDDRHSQYEDNYQRWRNNNRPPVSPKATRYERDSRAYSPDPRRPRESDSRGHQRAASPEPYRHRPSNDRERDGRRGRSPTRGAPPPHALARAMSPPPGHELRKSYFPPDSLLPNYLQATTGDYTRVSPRALSPTRSPRGPSPPRSHYGGGPDDTRHPRQPKYTASNLGLRQGQPAPRGGPPGGGRPRSDEGYLSMDRENPYRSYPDHGGYDNHQHHHSNHRGYNRNDSPPPRQVLAGDAPHPELNQESSGQPFLY